MAVIGAEMLYNDGVHCKTTNSWANYEEFYISEGTSAIWCTAWCHIGHQLQFISEMKHTEFKPILEKRVQHCIEEARRGNYTQY